MIKKLLIASFIAMLFVSNVTAVRISFDDLNYKIITATGTTSVSLPSTYCLLGVTITNLTSAENVNIALNSNIIYSGTPPENGILEKGVHICSSYFNIAVSLYSFINGTAMPISWHGQIQLILAPTHSPYYSVSAPILKYIPPGALDTTQGILLNNTLIKLNQTFNLTTGTVSFYLRYYGGNIALLSYNGNVVVGVNNSVIYVKSNGEVWYGPRVNVNSSQYQLIAIGVNNNTGYILVNNSVIHLNGINSLKFNEIGGKYNANALLDELDVQHSYIPPDQVAEVSKTLQYTIFVDNRDIKVRPEGGTKLGLIDVIFLSHNYTAINTATLGPDSTFVTAPNGTIAIVLSRAGISRTYLLGNYSTIEFPAEDTKLIITHITVTPEQFDYLTIKTLDGTIATRIPLQDNQGDFAAVYGAQYIFTFEKGNITRSRVYTVATSNLIFYLTTSQFTLQPPLDFQAYYNQKTKLVWVVFEDASENTKYLNITLTGYQNYREAWQIHDFENRTYGLYILTANSTDTDYVVAKLTANINGSVQTFERTVYVGTNGAVRTPFPTTLVPPAFIMLTAALLGIFVFPGTAPALMLLGGATSLSLLAVLGWIPAVPGLIATLTLLGVLALVVYRRD